MPAVHGSKQNSPTHTPSGDFINAADARCADAREYQTQSLNEALTKRKQKSLIVKAYWAFSEAIALYEKGGDFANAAFKEKLACVYEDCSYTAARYRYLVQKGEKLVLGAAALQTSLYKKAIELYAQTIGDLQSDESLTKVWAQILRLHNLSMALIRVGSLGEAERYVLDSIDLQKLFARANHDVVRFDPRVWPQAHQQLAQISVGMNASIDHTLAIIDSGLKPFKPATLASPSGLKSYGELCLLKGQLIEQANKSASKA